MKTVETGTRIPNAAERKRLAAAAFSGLLLTGAFPKVGFDLLAWVALVPLLWAVDGAGRGSAFRIGFVFGLAHFLSLVYWVVGTMQTQITDSQQSTEEINQIVGETQANTGTLNTHYSLFKKNSGRAVFEVLDVSNRIFVTLAKIDHIVFKNNVYAFLFGEADSFKPVDHHNRNA